MNGVLRPVPVDSPVHRLWAGTKLVGLTVVGLITTWWPTWFALSATAVVVVLSFSLARIPLSVIPRPPRTLIGLFLFSGVLSVIGAGFLIWLRFAGFSLLMLFLVGLLGWTTPMSELPSAMTKLLRPLRRIGVPAEELVSVLALSLRLIPILASETRITLAARRVRAVSHVGRTDKARSESDDESDKAPGDENNDSDDDDEPSEQPLDLLGETMDLGVTILTSSLRRSREIGVALHARGTSPGPTEHRPFGRNDAIAAALVAIFVVTVAAVEL